VARAGSLSVVVGVCGVLVMVVSAPPAQAAVSYGAEQTLPFTGLYEPEGLAVDPAGDVFVPDTLSSSGVVELPAGSSTQQTLPFSGLSHPFAVAVDPAGDVVVADSSYHVVELPAGSSTQRTLPFTGLAFPVGVALDQAGDVFVASPDARLVVELPAGSSTRQTLPITGLTSPFGVAVDQAGDVFVVDTTSGRVVELPAGSSAQQTLPFTGLNEPEGVAVDPAGDVFVADMRNNRVLELPVVAQSQSISWSPQGPYTYGQPPVTLTASASSGLPVSYTVTSGPCSVSGSTLTITGAGSCVVNADQAGNSGYTAAPTVSQTITIAQADTSLAVAPAQLGLLSVTYSATLTSTFTHAPIAGQSVAFSGPVVLGSGCQATSNSLGVASCTVFPALVIALGPATYTASYAGNGDYLASTGTGQLTSGLGVPGDRSAVAAGTTRSS
jgi:streptogramin lyase